MFRRGDKVLGAHLRLSARARIRVNDDCSRRSVRGEGAGKSVTASRSRVPREDGRTPWLEQFVQLARNYRFFDRTADRTTFERFINFGVALAVAVSTYCVASKPMTRRCPNASIAFAMRGSFDP